MIETAILVDTDICGDMLNQATMLASGLNASSGFRARVVVFGPIGSVSAVRRLNRKLLTASGDGQEQVKVFHLPRPRGAAWWDAVSLARSTALANCGVLHCFSLSLLDVLTSMPGRKLLRPCCVSLTHWPGMDNVNKLRRLCRSACSKVICFSKNLKKDLVGKGLPSENCLVVGPELPAESQSVSKQEARRLLGIANDTDLLLADPEISCLSNHRQLTWAAAIIGQFRPKVRVLVPGSDGNMVRLRTYDDSLNPPSLGIYPQESFEPEVYYSAADLLVLPATGATWPVPVMRAARARLAVLASDNRYFREYLRDGENAVLFEANKHNAGNKTRRRIRPLATAIVRLLEDRVLAQQLASQLENDLRRGSSLSPSLPTHLGLYREIVGWCVAIPSCK